MEGGALERNPSAGGHCATGSRASAAAARVAARFANAPSYSEMLAEESRAAEFVPAELEAAPVAAPAWEANEAAPEAAATATMGDAWGNERRESGPALPSAESRRVEALDASSRLGPHLSAYESLPEERVMTERTTAGRIAETPAEIHNAMSDAMGDAVDDAADEEMQIAEAPQPVHANLIEFPRELVATRKVRPRIAEGPYGAAQEPGAQLSIFEVDPGAVSTLPAAADAAVTAAPPAWMEPEWSGIELEAQPAQEFAEETLEETPETVAAQAPAVAPALELAPMHRRLLAAVVDCALIAAAFLAAAFAAAWNAKALPGLHELELGAVAGLAGVAALYQVFFFTLARATPGMKYARIGLNTFTGQRPTRTRRFRRVLALALSVLPMGLGMMWAVFDEDRLCWHDRLSQTYLRRC